MDAIQKTCLVTGANGYLGSRVATTLKERGWRVVKLVRDPKPGTDDRVFHLGEEISPGTFAAADALVHCAYDFKQIQPRDIQRVNVEGSEKLLRAARAAGVSSIIYISSISAFEGCRSIYGQAKLAIERTAFSAEAFVIRPGLIYGDSPDGMFGKLIQQVERGKILPLFGGGKQIQYLIHEDDLTAFIADCVGKKMPRLKTPVTIAHDKPWTFREILETIAHDRGKQLKFIPFPWRLIWVGIKVAEAFRIPLTFRSDSLVSLIYQNPNPSFVELKQFKIVCRSFQMPHAKDAKNAKV